ncbi:GntR family transcriptional regulator [Arthrobacter sp. KNU40]|uniref:GntR family transcriptional regulator n=1 Tax=Arthrobacter sp. KNU40 TaxID=3447965 RepID=UPI003F5F9638
MATRKIETPRTRLGKKPLSQHVYDTLEAEIVSRQLSSGARLVEDEVAARLGLSRTPVREAFKMLAVAGWIELLPNAGATVRMPNVEDVSEAFRLRDILETEVTRLAVQRATPADIKQLQKIVEEGLARVGEGDKAVMARLNREFHDKLIDTAGNRMLKVFLGTIYQQIRWYFAGMFTIERQEEAWKQHAELVEALGAGDAEKAFAIMRAHGKRSRETFSQMLLGT